MWPVALHSRSPAPITTYPDWTAPRWGRPWCFTALTGRGMGTLAGIPSKQGQVPGYGRGCPKLGWTDRGRTRDLSCPASEPQAQGPEKLSGLLEFSWATGGADNATT